MIAAFALALALQAPAHTISDTPFERWRAQSIDRIETAARRGDKYAQFELGRRYELGDGLTRDLRRALRWYIRASRTDTSANYVYSGPVGSERYGRAIEIRSPTSAVGIPAAGFRTDVIRQVLQSKPQ